MTIYSLTYDYISPDIYIIYHIYMVVSILIYDYICPDKYI